MKQQQQKQVLEIHTKWHSKLDTLFHEQQKEYQQKIMEIHHSLLHPVESVEIADVKVEERVPVQVPSQDVQALMDMGFTKKDSEIALEISKNNMERAIMILLESPHLIQEHAQTAKLPRKKTPFSLRKSNSLTFLGEGEGNAVPQLDWSQKRSFSSPKLPQESPQVKKQQRVLSTSPFGKVGNFLEKAMDAFRLEDDILKTDEPEDSFSDTFTVYCGSQQLKTMYNLQLQVLDIQKMLMLSDDPLQRMAIKASTDQSLYSSSLSGLVVLVRQVDLPTYQNGKVNKCTFP
jgi:hypothetical protein